MNPMFLHNYHSHTARCGHASGSDKEMVEAAIANGFKTIGFSDHVMLPDIHQPRMRGDYSLLDDYINSVLSLRNEYKGIIDIKLGFECEYLGEPFDSYYKELLDKKGFDYLLLGQHCYFDKRKKEMQWYGDIFSESKRNELYVEHLIKGMESGLFLYVAHPDMFVYVNGRWNKNSEKTAHEICQVAEKLQIPFELNMARTRYERRIDLWRKDVFVYPYPPFWEIVNQYDIPVVVGVDAHSPKDYDVSEYEAFAEILRKTNLKFVPKLDI